MPDQYESVRSLPFPIVAEALGADMSKFKTRKAGQEYYGPCLIHGPKNNHTSFSYNVDGRWNCFSCNAKGRGMLDLVKAARSLGFQDAVAFLTPLATSTPAKEKAPQRGNSEATEETGELKPYAGKYEKYAKPCEWLQKRAPNASEFGIFFYRNDARKSQYNGRILILFKDLDGTLYGYMGRAIEGEPKYLVPTNFPKSRFLFGADILKAGKFGPVPLRIVYLLESPFAVLKFASLNLPAVSPFGWSVSEDQIEHLAKIARGVVVLPDSNKYQQAGENLAHLAAHLWLRFPPLPDGYSDPEQLSLDQIHALTH